MPDLLTDKENTKKLPPPIKVLNAGAVVLAIFLIIGFLFYSIIQAFSESGEAGLRSLAATALPLIIVTYITFFTELFRLPARVPLFNFYFVFAVWTIIQLILVDSYFERRLPLGEFSLSLTLSLLVSIYKRTTFSGFLSCSYGILSGFLLYVLLFGLPVD